MKFISVLSFVCAGLMLLAAVFIMIGGLIGSVAVGSSSDSPAGMAAGLPMIIMGVVYAVSSFLYIYPALKLWKYAGSIDRLVASGSEEDLVDALDQQRAFWKFIGIIMIVVMAIYLVAIVLMVIAMAFGAAMLN